MDIVEVGTRAGEEKEAIDDPGRAATGAGAVGMESLGFGSAKDSLYMVRIDQATFDID